MNKKTFSNLFNKYLILLIIFYVVKLILTRFEIIPIPPEYISPIFIIFFFMYNILLAILIADDLKKLNIKSRLTVLATIFFNVLGVCFFLFKLMEEESKAEE